MTCDDLADGWGPACVSTPTGSPLGGKSLISDVGLENPFHNAPDFPGLPRVCPVSDRRLRELPLVDVGPNANVPRMFPPRAQNRLEQVKNHDSVPEGLKNKLLAQAAG